MNLIVTLASAAAVVFMVFVAWALGFRTRARLADDAALRALVLEAEPHARLVDLARDRDGYGGVARLADGRWIAAAPLGDRFAVRTLAAPRILAAKGGVRLRFADVGFPALRLRFDETPAWLTP